MGSTCTSSLTSLLFCLCLYFYLSIYSCLALKYFMSSIIVSKISFCSGFRFLFYGVFYFYLDFESFLLYSDLCDFSAIYRGDIFFSFFLEAPTFMLFPLSQQLDLERGSLTFRGFNINFYRFLSAYSFFLYSEPLFLDRRQRQTQSSSCFLNLQSGLSLLCSLRSSSSFYFLFIVSDFKLFIIYSHDSKYFSAPSSGCVSKRDLGVGLFLEQLNRLQDYGILVEIDCLYGWLRWDLFRVNLQLEAWLSLFKFQQCICSSSIFLQSCCLRYLSAREVCPSKKLAILLSAINIKQFLKYYNSRVSQLLQVTYSSQLTASLSLYSLRQR